MRSRMLLLCRRYTKLRSGMPFLCAVVGHRAEPLLTHVVTVHRAVLLSKFIEGSAEDWDYVAAVLTNVTRMPDGRKLLLDPQRGFLRALATQLRSASLTRRRGCAAAFRNCAFGAQVCQLRCPLLSELALSDLALHESNAPHQLARPVKLPAENGKLVSYLRVVDRSSSISQHASAPGPG